MKVFFKDILISSKQKRNDTIFWAVIFSVCYIICNYLSIFICGYKQTFKTQNELLSAVFYFLTSVAIIIVCEIIRAILLNQSKKFKLSKSFFVFIFSLIIAVPSMIINSVSLNIIEGSVFSTIFKVVIPTVFSSILSSMLVISGGIIPSCIYLTAIRMIYVLPIVPNTDRFIDISLNIILQIIFIIAFECTKDTEDKETKNNKTSGSFNILIIGIVGLTVIFFGGLLPMEPTSIATGSMEPELSIGDMVIVSELEKGNIKTGDIIKFHKDGKYVIHRVDEIDKIEGKTIYFTKGDANNCRDLGYITDDDISGKIVFKIPWIGNFTLWLHSV